MAEERVQRRLAAILAADVVGYSWLKMRRARFRRRRRRRGSIESIKSGRQEGGMLMGCKLRTLAIAVGLIA